MSIRRSFLYTLTGQLMQLKEQLKARPVTSEELRGMIGMATDMGHKEIVKFLKEEGHNYLKEDRGGR